MRAGVRQSRPHHTSSLQTALRDLHFPGGGGAHHDTPVVASATTTPSAPSIAQRLRTQRALLSGRRGTSGRDGLPGSLWKHYTSAAAGTAAGSERKRVTVGSAGACEGRAHPWISSVSRNRSRPNTCAAPAPCSHQAARQCNARCQPLCRAPRRRPACGPWCTREVRPIQAARAAAGRAACLVVGLQRIVADAHAAGRLLEGADDLAGLVDRLVLVVLVEVHLRPPGRLSRDGSGCRPPWRVGAVGQPRHAPAWGTCDPNLNRYAPARPFVAWQLWLPPAASAARETRHDAAAHLQDVLPRPGAPFRLIYGARLGKGRAGRCSDAFRRPGG